MPDLHRIRRPVSCQTTWRAPSVYTNTRTPSLTHTGADAYSHTGRRRACSAPDHAGDGTQFNAGRRCAPPGDPAPCRMPNSVRYQRAGYAPPAPAPRGSSTHVHAWLRHAVSPVACAWRRRVHDLRLASQRIERGHPNRVRATRRYLHDEFIMFKITSKISSSPACSAPSSFTLSSASSPFLLVAAVATVHTGWRHRRGCDGRVGLAGIAPAQRRHRLVVGALRRLGVVAVDVDVVVLVVVIWPAARRRSAAAWRSRCVIVAADGDSAAAARVATLSSAGRQGLPGSSSPATST